MEAPAFQWYPKDCDTDENVRAMDDREFGFYMRLLNHSWLNVGLPEDLKEVARVIGRSQSYVRKIWPRVGRCFELRDGRWYNPKQENQRASVREFVDSRRHAAETRWSKQKQSVRNARAMHVECSASASPIASAKQNTPPNPPQAGGGVRVPAALDANTQTSGRFEEWFNRIWAPTRGNAHRTSAARAYLSVVTLPLEADAFECTRSYVAGPGADPRHGYRPDNFLFEMARDGFKARWPVAAAPVVGGSPGNPGGSPAEDRKRRVLELARQQEESRAGA